MRGIKEICQNENLNTSDSSESKCKYCLKIANLSIMAALTKEHEKSKNIFNNLDILNQEEDKDEMKRKSSFKHNDSDSEDEMPTKNMSRKQKDHSMFEKHINSFCTVYLDFDQHSDEVMSYLVSYDFK